MNRDGMTDGCRRAVAGTCERASGDVHVRGYVRATGGVGVVVGGNVCGRGSDTDGTWQLSIRDMVRNNGET